MATGNDIIKRCLRGIGFLAVGRDPTDSEANQALDTINDLIKSWMREDLMLWNQDRTSHSVTASDGDYTWGSTGNITSPARPDKLSKVSRLYGSGTSQLEIPLHIIQTWDEWRAYPLKNLESTYSEVVFLDPQYPNANLYYRPIATTAFTAILYTLKRLSALTLAGDISLPDGYERALRLNAMLELAPEFRRPEYVTEINLELAREAKGILKSANQRPRTISCDDPVLQGGGGQYNILADDYSGKVLDN